MRICGYTERSILECISLTKFMKGPDFGIKKTNFFYRGNYAQKYCLFSIPSRNICPIKGNLLFPKRKILTKSVVIAAITNSKSFRKCLSYK